MDVSQPHSIRNRILVSAVGFTLFTAAGYITTLIRVDELNQSLSHLNRDLIPMSRLLTQTGSDAELLTREIEKQRVLDASSMQSEMPDANSTMGSVETSKRPIWLIELLLNQLKRGRDQLESTKEVFDKGGRTRWVQWFDSMIVSLNHLKTTDSLVEDWDKWQRDLKWGVLSFDREIRDRFSKTESRVSELKSINEGLTFLGLLLSLLFLWLGLRALKPLQTFSRYVSDFAREINVQMPTRLLFRNDEVGALATEFHRLTLQLHERQKAIDAQALKLLEQNRHLTSYSALIRNVLDTIEALVVVYDEKKKITHLNERALKFLTIDDFTKVIGTDLYSWNRMAPFLDTASTEVFETEVYGIRYGIKHLKVPNSSLEIVMAEDLTKWLQIQDRLKSSEHLAGVGRLSAQVAHEIRNPLHSVGLEAEMILRMTDEPNVKSAIQSVLQSVDRLEKITENYLRLSRLTNGKYERFYVVQAFERALATYSQMFSELRILLDWSVPKEVMGLTIYADIDLFENALGNLIRNSIQAMSEVGNRTRQIEIRFSFHEESDRLIIEIEDSGNGIPVEWMSKLFQPFHTTKAQGTGLGLPFVKQVIEEAKGTVTYKTGPKWGGAMFVIDLPVVATTSLEKKNQNHLSLASNTIVPERNEGSQIDA